MAKTHDIARKICDEEINSGNPIIYSLLCDRIKKAGGIFRVAPGTTIGEYLQDYEDNGILKFVPKENYFKNLVI